tara:strand:+ start:475 stop:744 length:270 start_codon:yes stop_codon:yes gene_type:complete
MVDVVDENRPAIAEVIWEDAWIEADDVSAKEAIEFVPVLRSTVGYVISKDNDDCLVLATDLYQDDQTIINTPMVIPWGAIIDWWEFEVH